ncbi:hypothetical protein N7488_012281 [Penicillium malachiteum]|nr:hypothetical protein N7488_012281 [Penicillium malachiteum]
MLTMKHMKIGVALRSVTESGMYTGMHSICLDQDYIQRCRLLWWTVYVLERRMSSLLGVTIGISEDGIAEESMSASLPSLSRHFPKSDALHMQLTLCQILAKIDMTVYGTDGKVDRRYISATQAVLRDIANITDKLNTSFNLYDNEGGFTRYVSRISAHLHLLEHQV